ncbi:MAG: hypothetical protein LBG96_08985 [Tannerella sp.]|jgi:hypothetical protein|nr:hypothetical protein [Tannerella sp.]
MKLKKSIYYSIAITGMFLLYACELNELPVFDDKDAFVAFDRSVINVAEESGEVKIPVTLTSLAGLSGTVTFEVDATASTAVAGENYYIRNSSNTLTFSQGAPTQYIEMTLIDNDVFTGDLSVTFKLTSSSINLGANLTSRVVIVDNEHPLLMILGTYGGKLTSFWEDVYDAEITISKDESDIAKVWISNLDPYFASYGYVAPTYNYFYGVVNEEKTEIRIPVGQDIGYGSATVTLQSFDIPNADPDADVPLPAGSSIVIEILEDGAKLKFPNSWGVAASDGFWELYNGGAVLNKN